MMRRSPRHAAERATDREVVVARVVVRNRQVQTIDWTPPAMPFFERQREYPQGDSNP